MVNCPICNLNAYVRKNGSDDNVIKYYCINTENHPSHKKHYFSIKQVDSGTVSLYNFLWDQLEFDLIGILEKQNDRVNFTDSPLMTQYKKDALELCYILGIPYSLIGQLFRIRKDKAYYLCNASYSFTNRHKVRKFIIRALDINNDYLPINVKANASYILEMPKKIREQKVKRKRRKSNKTLEQVQNDICQIQLTEERFLELNKSLHAKKKKD